MEGIQKETSDNGSNTSPVIFTSQVAICSHSSKLPAALKCNYGALANTKAKMTTAFASAGLNSATMEPDTGPDSRILWTPFHYRVQNNEN